MPTNTILVNHVGLTPSAAKYCVLSDPPQPEFEILRLKDTQLISVFRGTLVLRDGDLGGGWVGDFSALRDEGIYQVRCGELRSRYFNVHQDVYYWPAHTIAGYFPAQRCGDTVEGWASPCHCDDGTIVETGERVDLSGGWHQSGDLRKWTWGLVLGMVGLCEFALQGAPRWDRGQLADEIRWGADHYVKLQRPDGGLRDTICLPLGWGAREWYDSDAPPAAQWNAARALALAAAYLRPSDPDSAERYLQAALGLWAYMTRPDRPSGPYVPPEIPPRGHDWMGWFYRGVYQGSANDWALRLTAASALYRATDDPAWKPEIAQAATALVALQVGATVEAPPEAGGCFWEGPESDQLANSYWYFWAPSGPVGLCEAARLLPEHRDAPLWRNAVERIATSYSLMAQRNAYGYVPTFYRTGDPPPELKVDENTPAGQSGRPLGQLESRSGAYLALYYSYFGSFITNHELAYAALFLRRAADLLDRPALRRLAQRQIDWVLGCNPLDASTVEGVGANQPHRGVYGEFFPPTPQIPGAVMVGLMGTADDMPLSFEAGARGHYGVYWLEYDAPPTGALLWLLADTMRGDHAG